jgi:uncharacterized HAD superfamily protein
MKFAFDVDGVITDVPEFFKVVIEALKNAGHEIHIITDFGEHFRKQREKELEEYGIQYDHLEITSDKEGYCFSQNIDFMVDDNMQYYFPDSESVPLSILKIKS